MRVLEASKAHNDFRLAAEDGPASNTPVASGGPILRDARIHREAVRHAQLQTGLEIGEAAALLEGRGE